MTTDRSSQIFMDMYKNKDEEKNSYFIRNDYESTMLDNALRDLSVRGSVLMVSGFKGMGNTSFLNWSKDKIESKGAPTVFFTFTDDDLINFRQYKFLAETIENYKLSNKLRNILRDDKSQYLMELMKSAIDFISLLWPPAALIKPAAEVISAAAKPNETEDADYGDIKQKFNNALANIGTKFLEKDTFLAILLNDVQWLLDYDLNLLKNLLVNVPPGIVLIFAFRYETRQGETLDAVFKRYNILKEAIEVNCDPNDEKRYQCYELKELGLDQIIEFAELKGFNKKFVAKIAADIYEKIGGVPDRLQCALKYIRSIDPEFSNVTAELLEETKYKCRNRDKWMYEKGLDDASRTLANKLCILRPFTGTTEVISCLMGHNVGHDDLEKIYFLKRHEIGKSYYYDFSLPGLKDFAKLNVESNSVWYTDLVSQYLKCVERFQAFFDQEVFDSTVSELSFRSKNWGNVGTIFQRAQKSMKYYPTIALELNEKAKIGAEDLKDNSLIAFALAQKGEIFLNIGKVEDAKQSFIESQISAQKIVDPSDKARALFEISKEFRDIKMFEDANRILVESLDLAQKMENPFSKIGALTKIGDAFRDLNDFKNATRAFDESLKSAQEIQNPIFRADVLSGISRSFHEIGKPEKAIQAINMSSASVQRIEDPSFKLDAMEKLCDRYQMIGENDKFIECAEQAKEITKMIDSESAYDAICLIKGVHPLRLEEGGIRFDMLARTEMGKDGNIYAIKDQVGIPLDRKINLGKPMTEAEAKKRTTIFRADGLPMCGTVGVRKYDEAVVALHHMWEFRNKWGYRIR